MKPLNNKQTIRRASFRISTVSCTLTRYQKLLIQYRFKGESCMVGASDINSETIFFQCSNLLQFSHTTISFLKNNLLSSDLWTRAGICGICRDWEASVTPCTLKAESPQGETASLGCRKCKLDKRYEKIWIIFKVLAAIWTHQSIFWGVAQQQAHGYTVKSSALQLQGVWNTDNNPWRPTPMKMVFLTCFLWHDSDEAERI